tara:strand:- start:626 stop:898 length:273 start_codon:yes stop_codon:yes gene_type:complete
MLAIIPELASVLHTMRDALQAPGEAIVLASIRMIFVIANGTPLLGLSDESARAMINLIMKMDKGHSRDQMTGKACLRRDTFYDGGRFGSQ